jgi:hypothetical protein
VNKATAEIEITITRNNHNEINLVLRDSASRIQFVDAVISLEDYAMIITGLSGVPIKAELRGLDNVGKTKVIEQRSITTTKLSTNTEYSKWLEENCQEEGWMLDSYLNSQRSIDRRGDEVQLNYSVYKYVEPESKQ